MNYKKIKGFNLVELIVSLGIMSVLIALSAPYYAIWLINMRIKNVAENINFAVIQARAESIKRNQYIFLTINSDSSWEINTENDELINQKKANESSKGIALNILPVNSNTLTFNGFGSLTNNIDATSSISLIEVNNDNSSLAGIEKYLVKIGSGGASFACKENSSGC